MKIRAIGAIPLVIACCAATAGPAEDALDVTQQWVRAFNARDVDAIVKLHAPDAQFFGTASRTLVTTTDGIRRYFSGAFSMGFQAAFKEPSIVVISDAAVVVSGLDDISGNIGRTTFVVGRRDNAWKIVHFHRSQQP